MSLLKKLAAKQSPKSVGALASRSKLFIAGKRSSDRCESVRFPQDDLSMRIREISEVRTTWGSMRVLTAIDQHTREAVGTEASGSFKVDRCDQGAQPAVEVSS